jgi:predicted small integral membrane protein
VYDEKTNGPGEQRSGDRLLRAYANRLGKSPVPIRGKRQGFLSFETNPWDRVFISILLTVAVHLLWMRFLEAHISLTFATILTLILSAVIVTRG